MSDITRSEAIKQLRLLKGDITFGIASKVENKNQIEALSIAIASLETDEAYDLEYELTKNDLGVDKPTIIDWNNCHTSEQLDSISTTKNDLGVDAISRQAVIEEMEKRHAEGDYITKGFINSLPSVTPIRPKSEWEQDHAILKAYSDGVNEVLDKIRAEMLEEMLSHSGTGEEVIQAYADGLKKGLEFIDKYKVESEE